VQSLSVLSPFTATPTPATSISLKRLLAHSA